MLGLGIGDWLAVWIWVEGAAASLISARRDLTWSGSLMARI